MNDEYNDLFDPTTSVQGSQFKMGTVTAVASGIHVQFDGETSPSGKVYKKLASYSSPAVNDRVLLLQISGTYIILGKIA
jgi:hypothetical protein